MLMSMANTPQALGVNTFFKRLSIFGNSTWEILLNEELDSPFFTSDYPIGVERDSRNPLVANRLVPLAPDVAVRITPNIAARDMPVDMKFPMFKSQMRTLPHREIRYINQLIVRCAEDFIFYCKNEEWVRPFIKRNRNYRIEAITLVSNTTRQRMTISGESVVPFDWTT